MGLSCRIHSKGKSDDHYSQRRYDKPGKVPGPAGRAVPVRLHCGVRARTVAILAHVCSFGLRPAFPSPPYASYLSYFVSGRWPETCRFPAVLSCFPAFSWLLTLFWGCFGAVLRLEPLTFNPSVLGSNPRGPTKDFRVVGRNRLQTGELAWGLGSDRSQGLSAPPVHRPDEIRCTPLLTCRWLWSRG